MPEQLGGRVPISDGPVAAVAASEASALPGNQVPQEIPGGGAQMDRSGLVMALLAYGLWGLFPIYFHWVDAANPFEIVAQRVFWTLGFASLWIIGQQRWRLVGAVFRQRRLLLGLGIAAMFIGVNWLIYVLAVVSNNVQEAALGYFLNPLMTVALGVMVLGERLRPWQWVAVGVGTSAGVYLAVAIGYVPVLALIMAASFSMYSLIKKKIGFSLSPLVGLAVETLVLTPFAVVAMVIAAQQTGIMFGTQTRITVLLVLSGVVTAIPLALFAAGVARVPLVTVGFVQFFTPLAQLLLAVFYFHEHLSPERWIGFVIVWVALTILLTDSTRMWMRSKRAIKRQRRVQAVK